MKSCAQRIPSRMLRILTLCLAAIALASTANAQLAVSSNDTKFINVDGVNKIVEHPPPDNVTLSISACPHPRSLASSMRRALWSARRRA